MQNTTHDNVILELTVRNHPGVMTHVCGLFARRAFNVEGILCLPIQDSDKSHIWLLVNDDQRLEQMISQIDKLEDVVKVQRNQSDPTMFNKIVVDSIGQRNSYVKTWGCGGFLNETNIYSRGKSLCF
ncbi:acetolactate synthase small subunit [Escherichia coli]|uniref:acetolactate synthase small subunit n=1 Tax=Escherichia coli TaxID=562 RepID=UPI000B33DAAF|nr:acetolactate synthase small subunit [Escherichia coli]